MTDTAAPKQLPEQRKKKGLYSYWPDIDTADVAKKVAHQAAWFTVFRGGFMLTFIILNTTHVTNNFLDYDQWSYIDVGISMVLAFFAFRMSRVAAFLSLAYYLLCVGAMYSDVVAGQPVHFSLFLIGIWVLAYVNGIRASFLYPRLAEKEAAASAKLPVINNSPINP